MGSFWLWIPSLVLSFSLGVCRLSIPLVVLGVGLVVASVCCFVLPRLPLLGEPAILWGLWGFHSMPLSHLVVHIFSVHSILSLSVGLSLGLSLGLLAGALSSMPSGLWGCVCLLALGCHSMDWASPFGLYSCSFSLVWGYVFLGDQGSLVSTIPLLPLFLLSWCLA